LEIRMDGPQRAAAAAAALDDMSKQEALAIMTSGLAPVSRAAALNRIKKSKEGLKEILDGLPAGSSSSGVLSAIEAAQADMALSYVEAVIARSPSADMRVAQFTGYKGLAADHAREIDAASKSAAVAAVVLDKIEKAAKQFRAVAKDPMIMVGVLQFWNKLVRPDPSLKPFRLLDEFQGITLDDLMTSDLSTQKVFSKVVDAAKGPQQLDAMLKKLQLTAKDLKVMAAWLGAAVVLLSVTTMVLNTIADEKHWATTLAKSAVSIGVPIALSQVLTAASVGAALQGILSLFPAAVAAIEVPPVAVVLVCVGLISLAAFAIEELFSWLLDTWFGGDIPASMRAEITLPMEMSMRKRMAAPMALSMV
jgi:hypothetical protein